MTIEKKQDYLPKIVAGLLINAFLIMEFLLMRHNPLIGWALMLLAAVNSLLYLLLRKMDASNNAGILSQQELGNAGKMLRYAAAALSFISLLTTSSGMKAFVFGAGQEWMAYVTSFAVQAILMVFGLLLCHFYTTIGSLEQLSFLGRRLLIGGLTLFFAAAIVMSSTFSYAFISENAYHESWDSDSETIIQTQLIQAASGLEDENERIGELLLTDILNNVQDGLLSAAKDYSKNLESAASQAVKNLQLPDITVDEDVLSIELYIKGLIQRYPRYEDDMRALENQYNQSFRDMLLAQIAEYKDIADTLGNLTGDDMAADRAELEQCRIKLQLLQTTIDTLRTEIDKLSNSRAKEDINSIRAGFRASAADVYDHIGLAINLLDQVLNSADTAYGTPSANSSTGTVSSSDTILSQIDGIQRDILLLKAQQIAGLDSNQNTGLNNTAVSDLISRIMNLIQDLSNAGTLPADSVKSLANLSEQVEEYGRYASLAQNLRSFQTERLAKSYYFAGIGSVDRETWKAARDEDFHTLFHLLNSLPRRSETHNTAAEADSSGSSEENNYAAAEVLHSLSVLRRDLLGDITDLERGLNYFKYEFRKMAYFSAFVAVFLDLGTFFTGCFLYGTKYIQDLLKRLSQISLKENPLNDSKRETPEQIFKENIDSPVSGQPDPGGVPAESAAE